MLLSGSFYYDFKQKRHWPSCVVVWSHRVLFLLNICCRGLISANLTRHPPPPPTAQGGYSILRIESYGDRFGEFLTPHDCPMPGGWTPTAIQTLLHCLTLFSDFESSNSLVRVAAVPQFALMYLVKQTRTTMWKVKRKL